MQVDRAEGFLRAGLPLIKMMPRELRLDVALFIHGGLAILRAIRRQNYDVWTRRPRISKMEKLRLCYVKCLVTVKCMNCNDEWYIRINAFDRA